MEVYKKIHKVSGEVGPTSRFVTAQFITLYDPHSQRAIEVTKKHTRCYHNHGDISEIFDETPESLIVDSETIDVDPSEFNEVFTMDILRKDRDDLASELKKESTLARIDGRSIAKRLASKGE